METPLFGPSPFVYTADLDGHRSERCKTFSRRSLHTIVEEDLDEFRQRNPRQAIYRMPVKHPDITWFDDQPSERKAITVDGVPAVYYPQRDGEPTSTNYLRFNIEHQGVPWITVAPHEEDILVVTDCAFEKEDLRCQKASYHTVPLRNEYDPAYSIF